MTNWRVVMKVLAWLLFAFGLLQVYEAGQSAMNDDWIMMVFNAFGGSLTMFSAFLLTSREVIA